MEKQNRYRHELKYAIDYAEYMELASRVKMVMQRDAHAGADGVYRIRSIYFDNAEDKALREKINGRLKREKFRIRYYNDDFSFFMLEKKLKNNNLCMKVHAALTKTECRNLLDGDTDWMKMHDSGLVRELYAKMHYQMLRPRVLVSYQREAYVFPAGNVRITFDSEVRTTLYHRKFLETDVLDISAADNPRERILEVKYDAFLPEIIQNLIQTDRIRQQAFSKYGICRRFG